MKPKFKVGDKVEAMKEWDGAIDFYKRHGINIGEKYIIENIDESYGRKGMYIYRTDKDGAFYDDEIKLANDFSCKHHCKGCSGKCDLWEEQSEKGV
jgi:hypothetical protein